MFPATEDSAGSGQLVVPGDLVRYSFSINEIPVHAGTFCSKCQFPIRGIRYVTLPVLFSIPGCTSLNDRVSCTDRYCCLSCRDVSLCEKCEALPKTHDLTHVLLAVCYRFALR